MDDFFVESIKQHRHEFYRFVQRNVWDPSAADDVFSAAILSAYEIRRQFKMGTNFRAWMFKILMNKCLSANRERSRSVQNLSDAAGDLVALHRSPEYFDVLEDPEKFVAACGDEVKRAISRLSTVQRSCFLLRAVEGFTYKEISKILEIPMGTVMTHLNRGRARLRRDLMEYATSTGFLRRREPTAEDVQVDERDLSEGQVSA